MNKKKELSDLREALKKRQEVKEKARAESKKFIEEKKERPVKTETKLPTNHSIKELKKYTEKEQEKSSKPKISPVKARTVEVRMPKPISRGHDMDLALAAALQQEEMELNEQLFMIEMMEERDRYFVNTGQDQVDPDNMTYEQLMELQEKVGKVKVGLSAAQVAKLKQENYSPSIHKLNSCSICLNEFEDEQPIIRLVCHHLFDPDCLKRWVDDHKNCPICKTEISG